MRSITAELHSLRWAAGSSGTRAGKLYAIDEEMIRSDFLIMPFKGTARWVDEKTKNKEGGGQKAERRRVVLGMVLG